MPYRDKARKLASQRKHYAAHREQVIAKVAARKWSAYGGTCKNCGGPTMGNTKAEIPEWCSKPECVSVQRQLLNRKDRMDEKRWAHRTTTVRHKGRFKLFCSCGWQSSWNEDMAVLSQESREHTGLKEKENRRPDGR